MTSLQRNNTLFNYVLSQDKESDKILKKIVEIALIRLFSHIPIKVIKDIQLTGSIANGEGTVIKEERVIASDVDILVYLNFPYFIIAIMKGLFEKLSQEVSHDLSSKGWKVHICFTGSIKSAPFSHLLGSHIYDFEFLTNKSFFNSRNSRRITDVYIPTKRDALQLTFTTAADYLFLDSVAPSNIEKVYLLAKRFLTLIHSLFIFEGKPKASYEERSAFAETSKFCATFLSVREKELIEKFTKFKLSGQISYIFDAFQSKDTEQIINLQKELLVNMIMRTLYYELQKNYDGLRANCKRRHNNEQLSAEGLLNLLNAYFHKTGKSFISSLIYVYILTLISIVTRRVFVLHLVGPLLVLRHSLTSVANYLVGLMFISRIYPQKSEYIQRLIKSIINKLGLQLKEIKEIWDQANQVKYLSY
jgi:hypothetical protein